MKEVLKVYEIEYLDSECGDRVMNTEIVAYDSCEALDIAFREDYYFGELLSCKTYSNASEKQIKEYMDNRELV